MQFPEIEACKAVHRKVQVDLKNLLRNNQPTYITAMRLVFVRRREKIAGK